MKRLLIFFVILLPSCIAFAGGIVPDKSKLVLEANGGDDAAVLIEVANSHLPTVGDVSSTAEIRFYFYGTADDGYTYQRHIAANAYAFKGWDWYNDDFTEGHHYSGIGFGGVINGTHRKMIEFEPSHDTGGVRISAVSRELEYMAPYHEFKVSQDMPSTQFYGYYLGRAGKWVEMVSSNTEQSWIYSVMEPKHSGTAAANQLHLEMSGGTFGDGSVGDGNNYIMMTRGGSTRARVSVDGEFIGAGVYIPASSTPPATCDPSEGNIWIDTDTDKDYYCKSTDTWVEIQ